MREAYPMPGLGLERGYRRSLNDPSLVSQIISPWSRGLVQVGWAEI